MLVFDCSVPMAWVMPDESSDSAQSVREAIERYDLRVIAPPLFFLEAVNVLEVTQRRGRVAAVQVDNALRMLERLPVSIDTESVLFSAALSARKLMQQHALTAYDASYLELAKRRSLPLSTLDKALRRAAEAERLFFRG